MIIEELFKYRESLLEDSKDEDGFISERSVLEQILPLLLDSKLLDSEDFNESPFNLEEEKIKINGYLINESGERLQIFIVNEESIFPQALDENLKITQKLYYENLFNNGFKFIVRATKGQLLNKAQDSSTIQSLINHLSSSEGFHQFDVIELFVLSATATIETRGTLPQPKRIEFEDEILTINHTTNKEKIKKDILIIKKLIDLNFLYGILLSQGNREALIIDFKSLFTNKIEVIKAAEESNFESYLCVFPAKVLSELYKRYSSRLLEKNVRSFLQFKGANKGIRETIRLSPEKFIAFNNGITITATAKELETIDGKAYINSLTDFQIVNGGQTTASIYFTQKDGFPIDKVKVMAKINVALDVTEEKLDALISDISKFSNSQTKVSNVDLGSRNPQLNKLKSLSESIVTPSGRKWFFEKSRGEFNTKLRIAGSNKSRIEKEYPKDFRFTKEQLGKYFTAWGDQPYVVKKGGEKVFRFFIEEITGEGRNKKSIIVNRDFYENLISKIILFLALEKIYGQGKNAMGQIRSAVIPYSISVVYTYTDGAKSGKRFDLSKIWKKEKLDELLVVFFSQLMELMNDLIKKYSESEDYGEFAKNKKLWENISNSKEIKDFMSSKLSNEILEKYSIPYNDESKSKDNIEVDFGQIRDNIEIHSRGKEFYESIKKIKKGGITNIQERKLDSIISAIIKSDNLNEDIVLFAMELIFEIRKDTPEVFDQLGLEQNFLLENTLKFIILKYNQAIENGIDIKDFFQSIEKKTLADNNKHASVYSKIAINLSIGLAPSVNDIILASHYFSNRIQIEGSPENNETLDINLNILRQMVEWDSKMKILSQGERAYLADLAYELKSLTSFHNTNAKKHLKTLLNSGFKLESN